MAAIHRLCEDLGINHPLEHSTCIGYSQKKPTCAVAVAEPSRRAALRCLAKICNALADDISPRLLRRDLEAAASLLHCKRFHQDQAPAQAQQWEERLHYAMTERQEAQWHWHWQQQQQQRQRACAPERAPRQRISNRQPSRLIEPPSRTLRSMQSTLEDYRRSSRPLSLPQSTTPTSTSTSTSPRAPLLMIENTSQGSDGETEVVTNDTDDDSSEEFEESPLPIVLFRPIPKQSQRRGSSSSSSSTPSLASLASSTSTLSSPPPSPSSSNPISPPQEECGICLSQINRRSKAKWTCDTCHKDVHAECFDEWAVTCREGNVRCIYCRSHVTL